MPSRLAPPRTALVAVLPIALSCLLAACSTPSPTASKKPAPPRERDAIATGAVRSAGPATSAPKAAAAPASPPAESRADAAVHLLPGDTLATDPRRSVVRIAMPESSTQWWDKVRIGTGVYIGAGRFLTAHHVLYTGKPIADAPLNLSIRAYDAGRGQRGGGGGGGGRRMYTDPTPAATPARDTAVITLDEIPPNVHVATIARERPKIGDKLTGYGLGAAFRGGLRELPATVVSRSMDGSFFAIDAATVHGDSGGPIFNDRGELVGLMLGGGPDYQPWRVTVYPDRELEFSYTYPDFRSASRIKGETLVIDLTQLTLPK